MTAVSHSAPRAGVRRPRHVADSIGGWKEASRLELSVLGMYFLTLIVVSDVLNLRLGVEVMTAAVVFASILISRMPGLFLRDWWVFALGLVLWNLSGPIAASSPFAHHLDFMLNTDRFLFFGRDPTEIVQHNLAPTAGIGALDWLTAIAYNLHVPELYITGYFLWRVSRTVYLQFVAAALILLVVGFISFILFPAVPPWLASKSYGKLPFVTNRFGPVLHANPLPFHGTPLFYIFKFKGDAVAAFPSEHAAFPLLELLAFARAAGRTVTIAFALWVAWVLLTILYLGEHWVTDALAGYLYALVIFGAVIWFTERGPTADRLLACDIELG